MISLIVTYALYSTVISITLSDLSLSHLTKYSMTYEASCGLCATAKLLLYYGQGFIVNFMNEGIYSVYTLYHIEDENVGLRPNVLKSLMIR